MRKEIVVLAFMVFLFGSAFSLSINLYDTSGNIYDTYYYDSNAGAYGKASVVVEVCNGTTDPTGYVTLAYGTGGEYLAVAKSLCDGAGVFEKLGQPYDKNGERCANATLGFTVSPPADETTIPNWTYSAWPAHLWVVISSDNTTFDSSDTFLHTNGYMKGTYNVIPVEFNSTTGILKMNVISSRVYLSETSSLIKDGPDSSLLGKDYVLYGICVDSFGDSCADSGKALFEDLVGSDLDLDTGHAGMTDQESYTMYFVINSIGYQVDLGANLKPISVDVPQTIYWGQKVPVTVTIRNIGNVPVTSSFVVEMIYTDPNGNEETFTKTVDNDIAVGNAITVTFNEPWQFEVTGTGNITFIVDFNNNINETNEADNEITKQVQLEPSYNISFSVNGETQSAPYTLPNSGVPYPIEIKIFEQPGNNAVEKQITIVEKNGLSLLSPDQSNVENRIYLNVPVEGIQFTLVPTNLTSNYELYITGLKFYNGSDVVDKLPIKVEKSNFEPNTFMGIANPAIVNEFIGKLAKIYYYLFINLS